MVSQYQYDNAERLDQIRHELANSSFTSVDYDYDLNGNRERETLTQGAQTRITTYAYDAADRLTRVIYPDREVVYTLDDAANRMTEAVTATDSTVLADKTYNNNRDQLIDITDAIYGWLN